MGDKESLRQIIYEITEYLSMLCQGSKYPSTVYLSGCLGQTIARRHVQIGIFDIHLPLIYEEGKKMALRKEIEVASEDIAGAFSRLSRLR